MRSFESQTRPGRQTIRLATVAMALVTAVGALAARSPAPLIHLELSLPAFRLDVFLRDERVRTYRVAIGMRDYRTPRGSFEISRLEWNPWWVPPKSDWAKNERVTPPGPDNPMGRVRLAFREPYFIHGTPDEASLGKAASHGCVRLSNADAVDLATLIQRTVLGTVVSDSLLRRAIPSRRTLVVSLPQRLPLEIRYDLAEVVADTLFIYSDRYRLGTSPAKSAAAALEASGLDSTAVDFARIRSMSRYPGSPLPFRIQRRSRP